MGDFLAHHSRDRPAHRRRLAPVRSRHGGGSAGIGRHQRSHHRHGAAAAGERAGCAGRAVRGEGQVARSVLHAEYTGADHAGPRAQLFLCQSAQHRLHHPGPWIERRRGQPGERRAGAERRLLCRRRLPCPPGHGSVRLFRYRADRSPARPAGHAVRQEHHGGRDQHRLGRARLHQRREPRTQRGRAPLRPGARFGNRAARRRYTGLSAIRHHHPPRRRAAQRAHRAGSEHSGHPGGARAGVVAAFGGFQAAAHRGLFELQQRVLHAGLSPRRHQPARARPPIPRTGSGGRLRAPQHQSL